MERGARGDGLTVGPWRLACLRERGKGLTGLGCLFFLTEDFSSFSKQLTHTTFKLKLLMSSKHFQKICTIKTHPARHIHLVSFENKIKALFKIE